MISRLSIAFCSLAALFGFAYTANEALSKTTATTDHTQILAELHQAKHLLDHANHMYNGHRAKADHDISKAIHILHHEHHKKGTAKATTAPKASTKEAAQVSDTQLRQAEKLVRAAILTLDTHHGEKGHHASKILHEAVHEIELAIHLHHKHHAKNAVVKN